MTIYLPARQSVRIGTATLNAFLRWMENARRSVQPQDVGAQNHDPESASAGWPRRPSSRRDMAAPIIHRTVSAPCRTPSPTTSLPPFWT